MPKQKIMLLEDDVDTKILLSILLNLENYEVIHTEIFSENDLMDQIRKTVCEVLMIDVYLNGIDGISMLKRIRSELNGYHPFVIMTSGLDLSHPCIEAGADCFLQKPYDPGDLLSALSSRNYAPQVS
jgi:two-component system OmpR family response regulator